MTDELKNILTISHSLQMQTASGFTIPMSKEFLDLAKSKGYEPDAVHKTKVWQSLQGHSDYTTREEKTGVYTRLLARDLFNNLSQKKQLCELLK